MAIGSKCLHLYLPSRCWEGDAWGYSVSLAKLLHNAQGCCVSITGRKSILGAPAGSNGLSASGPVNQLIQAACHVLPEYLGSLITNTCVLGRHWTKALLLAGRGLVSAWEQPLHLIGCEMIRSRTSLTLGTGLQCQYFTLPIY